MLNQAFRFILSFSLLLAFFGAGEGVVRLLGLDFPGSVIGLLLLTGSLMSGLLDVRHVESAADFLLSYLGMLFVPPAVAIMLYFGLVVRDWLPLLAGTVLSLVAVLWTTAFTAHCLMRGGEGQSD